MPYFLLDFFALSRVSTIQHDKKTDDYWMGGPHDDCIFDVGGSLRISGM